MTGRVDTRPEVPVTPEEDEAWREAADRAREAEIVRADRGTRQPETAYSELA